MKWKSPADVPLRGMKAETIDPRNYREGMSKRWRDLRVQCLSSTTDERVRQNDLNMLSALLIVAERAWSSPSGAGLSREDYADYEHLYKRAAKTGGCLSAEGRWRVALDFAKECPGVEPGDEKIGERRIPQ